MSRKILYLGTFLIILGLGYGAYQFIYSSAQSPTVSTQQITELDELPEIAQPKATRLPTVVPTRASVPRQVPEKLVLLAESATPGRDSKDPFIKDGKILLTQGKFQEAQTAFKQANQQDAVALYYEALMSSYFAQRAESETFITTLKALPNLDAKIRNNIQKIVDAYALFDTYQDGRQEFLGALLAKQFLVIGEVDLAIGKLEYLKNKVEEYDDINTLLGAAYLTKGNFDRAVTILSEALPSERPEIYYWLGVAHLYQKNFNKAVAAFQLALNKGYRPAFKPHEKMGDAYLSLNNFEQAVIEYKAAYATPEGAEYADLYVRPVWLLIDKLKRPAEALEVANIAVSKLPRSAMAYNLVGWAQLGLKNFPEAKLSLDRAITLDPTLPAVYLNLGNYFLMQGNADEAKNAYAKAVTFDKNGSSISEAAQAHIERLETLEISETTSPLPQ